MIRICLSLWCCLMVVSVIPAQPDTLDLETVLEMARRQSLPAFRARADWSQAQYRHQSFRAGLLPQVTLSGTVPNYINTFSQTTQPDGSIAFQRISYNNSFLALGVSQTLAATGTNIFVQSNLQQYDDFASDLRRYNGVPFRIGVQQTFSAWNPTRWQLKLDPVRMLEATKQYQFDLEVVSQAALTLYFDLLLAQIDGELAKANLSSSFTLYGIAKARFELGKISENDLLQLQLEQINARKATNDASQAVQVAAARLRNFLRMEDPSEIYLRSPEADSLPEVDISSALQRAAASRPEYETWRRRQLETAEQTARIKAENGFQVTVQASVGYAGSATTFSPIYQNPQSEQGIWLELSLPLLNWGKGKAETRLMQMEQTYTTEWVNQQNQELENELRQVVRAWRQVQETLQFAQQAQEIAQRQFDISQNRYRLGEISTTDLTLSLRAKDLSRRAYMSSLREFWQTAQQLRLLTLYDFLGDSPIQHPLP
ncbi:MAG: TolC family protein [Bacteroidia bacterium]|nr:TolC family protein [Bacteroidia bacterium]